MYVDYEYYAGTFLGTMSVTEFLAQEQKAEAYLRSITYLHGDIFAKDSDTVKNAVCAVADVYHSFWVSRKKFPNGQIKSENNDGYSVTYITERTDGQTDEELLRRKAYDAAYSLLLPTGWLSRKVGCCHDHKCGFNYL